MKLKKYISLILAIVIFTTVLPMHVFAEEYISLKDIADANGYEYFYYEDNDSVNMRSATYILSFQKDNVNVGYKTVVGDVGTITLKNKVKAEGDTLYISKTDAQTKLIRQFPNTPSGTEDASEGKPSSPTKVPQSNFPSGSVPSDWAINEVNRAKKNGLVTDNTTRNYTSNISREYFCELVMKLYEKITGSTVSSTENPFNDTYNTEILKAYKLGIVNGISSTEFAPNSSITRQEICAMLVRAIGVMYDNINIEDYQYTSFSDSGLIASWAMDSVQFAYDNNIIQGIGDNKIDPLGHATCEQAILLVNRIYENRDNFQGKEDVIETLKRLEFEDNGEVNAVSVSFSDGRDASNVRIREIDSDDLIYTTTGLKGPAVSITTKEDFDTATIAFDYNPNGLGGTNPSDLMVGWYNTDLDRIELLESKVNTAEHTVSVETTHFSEYILVDSKEWYDVWQRGQTIVRDTDRDGNYAENFNVQLIMDCSDSMTSDMISRSQTVIYEFIERLSDDDKFSVVHFGTNASTVISCDRKGDIDMNDVRQQVMSKKESGSTYYGKALQECINNMDFNDPDYTNIIVFLTDGDPSDKNGYINLLNELAFNDVRIAAVGLETETSYLKELAERTNGQCLYAYNTETLDLLYESIQGSLMGVEATDTDDDGIPDLIEMTGMKTRFGTIVKTDPTKKDTDGDGLYDSEEMGKLIVTDDVTAMDRKRGILQCVYYEYLSDPVEGHDVSNSAKAKVDCSLEVDRNSISENGEFYANLTITVKSGTARDIMVKFGSPDCIDIVMNDYPAEFAGTDYDGRLTVKSLSKGSHEYRIEMECTDIKTLGYCNNWHEVTAIVTGSNFNDIKSSFSISPKYKTVAFDFEKTDIKESKSLTMREWHPFLGLSQTMLELDDDAEALVNNTPVQLDAAQFIMSWINNSQEITYLHADINNKNQICIKYGEAIELYYSGKKISLSEILVDKYYNFDPSIIFTSDDKADECIRNWFGLTGNGKYYMKCNFGRVYIGDYGYYLLIENEDVYQVPIIHEDTSLEVYYSENGQTKYVFDAADMLRNAKIKLADEEKGKVLEQLRNNNYIF